MKKTLIIIAVVFVIAVLVYSFTYAKDPKKEAIDGLIEKWEGVSKKHSSGAIDKPVVKTELNKLATEDLTTLNTFTDKMIEAKSALDYIALAGDALTARDILRKTNLSNVIQGLFPEVFK